MPRYTVDVHMSVSDTEEETYEVEAPDQETAEKMAIKIAKQEYGDEYDEFDAASEISEEELDQDSGD